MHAKRREAEDAARRKEEQRVKEAEMATAQLLADASICGYPAGAVQLEGRLGKMAWGKGSRGGQQGTAPAAAASTESIQAGCAGVRRYWYAHFDARRETLQKEAKARRVRARQLEDAGERRTCFLQLLPYQKKAPEGLWLDCIVSQSANVTNTTTVRALWTEWRDERLRRARAAFLNAKAGGGQRHLHFVQWWWPQTYSR